MGWCLQGPPPKGSTWTVLKIHQGLQGTVLLFKSPPFFFCLSPPSWQCVQSHIRNCSKLLFGGLDTGFAISVIPRDWQCLKGGSCRERAISFLQSAWAQLTKGKAGCICRWTGFPLWCCKACKAGSKLIHTLKGSIWKKASCCQQKIKALWKVLPRRFTCPSFHWEGGKYALIFKKWIGKA